MRRKSNIKTPISESSQEDSTDNNRNNTDNLYKKRLRTSRRPPKRFQLDEEPVLQTHNHIPVESLQRSTIFTYPIEINNSNQQYHRSSPTILSESVTAESAFYGPSISHTSIQTTTDFNNNHVTTWDSEKKRKHNTIEHVESPICAMLSDRNIDDNTITKAPFISCLPTTPETPKKRPRILTDDSLDTETHSSSSLILIDDDTIDINQTDHKQNNVLVSKKNQILVSSPNSMDLALKMVQPIVDIIFNAFEDQFKNFQSKSFQLSSLNQTPSIPSMRKITPPSHPIVLQAVNFNIQLTAKQSTRTFTNEQSSNTTVNDNLCSQKLSYTDLKQKLISFIPSNHLITNNNERTQEQLKRLAQLAVFGISVLCGYLFF